MQRFVTHKYLYTFIAVAAIVSVITMTTLVRSHRSVERITTVVDRGAVQALVSVSGVAKAEQIAALAFPVTGIVSEVLVDEGSDVVAGDTLVTLESASLYADRQDALAAVAQAIANRDELLAGPTDSSRTVTAETVERATEALATTKETESQKIANAYTVLLSSGLTAYTNNPNEDAIAPTISGTYTCDTEGTYTLDVFSSAAPSGYSYKLTGLETGTYNAGTEQPAALGTCGLEAQFDADSVYGYTTWHIDIPNTRSSNYIANRNAYSLTVTQAESAITLAEQELALATASAANTNAPARSEAITRANASITQARARLARIDAELSDRTLRAPFSGTITEVDIAPGETVTTAPIITLLASADYEITARIPEIDIGKLEIGQRVSMTFDARDTETLTGTIDFIALKATEIDGVAYYEALITPDTAPSWMRSGLNADIEIIVTEIPDTLRIPQRYVNETDSGTTALILRGDVVTETPITVVLSGNDGYAAITGLNAGDVVVAP